MFEFSFPARGLPLNASPPPRSSKPALTATGPGDFSNLAKEQKATLHSAESTGSDSFKLFASIYASVAVLLNAAKVKNMPETGGANIEIAHRLSESEEDPRKHTRSRIHQVVEIVEAVLLATVAIFTAWSGYQSARWDSVQSELYGRSSRLRVEAQALEIEANQAKEYDAGMVVEWLKAETDGKTHLADFFERRMLPEFQPAFQAWKKTDPLHNPQAPIGPAMMPGFQDLRGINAAKDNKEATELFEKGTRARERADEYVRVTVFLATVLLLVAISQRFRSHQIRVGLVALAFFLLIVPIWRVLTLPRM